MRLISERTDPGTRVRWKYYVAAGTAVAATAVAGSAAVDPTASWYRALSKPRWQPPPWVFGAVWTPLYASIAWAGGRALDRASPPDRKPVAIGLAVNLTLNAAWNWLFFRARSPRAGLLGTLALDLSNAHLLVRTALSSRSAGAALVPYAAWCAFATVLSADLARRNPPGVRLRPA
ncbi:TspO/MBR family protein [Streptomyces sp. NBC_00467]|uniref:TspO/MBR family protein n=1 Tax=Streptomyces sp. NBC_00467 TaxID=2975752 RepID=UPI002E17E19A